MQTTLLGVAIAIILALVAALVGPLLINWGNYRSVFEAEATRLVGVDVHVKGQIDARLLPSPRLVLHDIEIGHSASDGIRARSLNIEFALSPLLRGEWRATDLHLSGPQLHLGLDRTGRVKAPALTFGFKPDALTIDRLGIDGGKLILTDATNGKSVTLDHLYFNGQAASLVGPFKGEGGFTAAGDHFPFRIGTGRYNGDGTLKLHVNVDPVEHPLSVEADGNLSFGGGTPKFDGILNVRRLTGVGTQTAGKADQPWYIRGKLTATAGSALMENAEFQYGTEKRGVKLTGVANLTFGRSARFKAELSGRQLDLDGVLDGGHDTRAAPGAALRKLVAFAGNAFRPPIPMQIGVGIDAITLGGGSVENVRGDISTNASGWSLNDFEFRAPGYTQAKLSGRLTVLDKGGVTFVGPAAIDSNDPNALSAWLEGRAPPARQDLRPLSVRGDLTLSGEKIAFERLRAKFAQKTITGRFAYVFAAGKQPSKLDAALNAPELDLDVALGFGQALVKGSGLARPHDMTITADVGRATIAGIEGHGVSARVKVDADRWQIDRLAVADLGGASFSAGGNLTLTGSSPQGSLQLDLNAPDPAPVMTVLSRFAPATVKALERSTAEMAPAKLHAQLSIAGAAPSRAKLGVDGKLGKVSFALNGEAQVEPKEWRIGDMRVDGKLTADSGKALVVMLGLDRYVAVRDGPGALTLAAKGPATGKLHVSGRLTANGLEAKASGTANPFADSPSATLRAAVAHADLAPLRGPSGGEGTVPVAFVGRVALAGGELTFSKINATVAGANLRGTVAVSLDKPHRLKGALEADSMDGAGLIAGAIGMPAASTQKDGAWAWSSAPFGPGVFGDYAGQLALKIYRVALLPRLTAREFHASLNLGHGEMALDDMGAVLAGGKFSGSLSFKSGDDGLAAHGKFALAEAESASLLPAAARPPVTGALGLSVDLEGNGLSPVALIGSLHGTGKVTLDNAEFAGLDPHAFDTVTRAVDDGLPVKGDRISEVVRKALESGQLAVKRAEAKLAVNAGLVRLDDFSAECTAADLSLKSTLDLTDGTVDARLVLAGSKAGSDGRPDIFMALKGPAAAPVRNIDVSALTGWLTLRSVENQAKRLKALQQAAPAPMAERAQPQSQPEQPKNEPTDKRASIPAPDGAATDKPIGTLTTPPPKRQSIPLSKRPQRPKMDPTARREVIRRGVRAKPHRQRAPALPAPIDIHPLPVPEGAAPEASVSPQR